MATMIGQCVATNAPTAATAANSAPKKQNVTFINLILKNDNKHRSLIWRADILSNGSYIIEKEIKSRLLTAMHHKPAWAVQAGYSINLLLEYLSGKFYIQP